MQHSNQKLASINCDVACATPHAWHYRFLSAVDSHAWEQKDDRHGVHEDEDVRRAPGVVSDHDQEPGDGVSVEVHVCDRAHHEEGQEDEDAARAEPTEAG